jgi:anti-sigma factor RsiW
VSIDCRRARELAHDFLDATIGSADAQALASHLDACPYCPPLYSALEAGVAALRERGADVAGRAEAVLASVIHRITSPSESND